MSNEVEFKESPRDGDADGFIQDGTPFARKPIKREKAVTIPEASLVALYSKGNISWPGVGKLSKGFTIVKEDTVEKWLTRKGVRVATPEEVAGEYGL